LSELTKYSVTQSIERGFSAIAELIFFSFQLVELPEEVPAVMDWTETIGSMTSSLCNFTSANYTDTARRLQVEMCQSS